MAAMRVLWWIFLSWLLLVRIKSSPILDGATGILVSEFNQEKAQ
ncbi:MAG: hypothetical protein ACTS73_09095 [Arsenophonus sp. NEOnobi-MAG3]